MNNACGCERGDDCTKTTVCALEMAVEDALEEGKCRFNCRTAKEAFMAGFDAGQIVGNGNDIAYREWRDK